MSGRFEPESVVDFTGIRMTHAPGTARQEQPRRKATEGGG